eukprot:UN27266
MVSRSYKRLFIFFTNKFFFFSVVLSRHTSEFLFSALVGLIAIFFFKVPAVVGLFILHPIPSKKRTTVHHLNLFLYLQADV